MTEHANIRQDVVAPPVVLMDPRGNKGGSSSLTRRERDYLFLTIYVRAQHLQFAEALVLIETLASMGDEGPDLLLARAVIKYQMCAFDEALIDLRHLDRIEPPNVMSSAKDLERSRVRSFMKAKCHFALNGELDDDAQASLDFYLRRKSAGGS